MDRYSINMSDFFSGVNSLADNIHIIWVIVKDELGDHQKLFYKKAFGDPQSAHLFLGAITTFNKEVLPPTSVAEWVDEASDVDVFKRSDDMTEFIGAQYSIDDYIAQRHSPAGLSRIDDKNNIEYVTLDVIDKSIDSIGHDIAALIGAFIYDKFDRVEYRNSYGPSPMTGSEIIPHTDGIRAYVTPGGSEGYLVYLEGYRITGSGSEDAYDIMTAKTFDLKAANTLASALTSLIHGRIQKTEIEALNDVESGRPKYLFGQKNGAAESPTYRGAKV